VANLGKHKSCLHRAKDPVGWIKFQKRQWRKAAAARTKRKETAERARKRGRGADDDLAEMVPRGQPQSISAACKLTETP